MIRGVWWRCEYAAYQVAVATLYCIAFTALCHIRYVMSSVQRRQPHRRRYGTVNPQWNQQLQLPFYEPFFREIITVEVNII